MERHYVAVFEKRADIFTEGFCSWPIPCTALHLDVPTIRSDSESYYVGENRGGFSPRNVNRSGANLIYEKCDNDMVEPCPCLA